MPIVNTNEFVLDTELCKRISVLPQNVRTVVNAEVSKLGEVVAGAVTQTVTLNELFLVVSKALVTVAEHANRSH